MSLIVEQSLLLYLLLTLLLAGSCAFMTGRALALGWRPLWQLIPAILLLGAATRFLHYALFSGKLLSLHYYITDTASLMIIALLAHRLTRTTQMVRQYHWLYQRTSPFGWREK